MGANVNSQAAMAQYSNQPAGMPPSAINNAVPDAGKKSRKGRRKKNKSGKDAAGIDDPNQYAQPS